MPAARLIGASGSGKATLAQAIAARSPDRDDNFSAESALSGLTFRPVEFATRKRDIRGGANATMDATSPT